MGDGKMKIWKDLSNLERGELLLAHFEGKSIEFISSSTERWTHCPIPSWISGGIYRIKKLPAFDVITYNDKTYIDVAAMNIALANWRELAQERSDFDAIKQIEDCITCLK